MWPAALWHNRPFHLQMVAGVGFGMLHLKVERTERPGGTQSNVMLKQQLQAPGLIFTAETAGVENRVCSSPI